MKSKNIKKLQTLKVEIPKIYGGWDGIQATGGGVVQQFSYESDLFVDENGDGKWSAGESMHFYHTTPTINKI
ncbi:hypothetical protein [Kordia sp.]|uniref:hypothetical protein n=1 Tax=Kordia sp. TaxID=1965332 RepID=UPI003D2C4DCC